MAKRRMKNDNAAEIAAWTRCLYQMTAVPIRSQFRMGVYRDPLAHEVCWGCLGQASGPL